MDSNLIGEQITRYRKALNMTQEELGKAVGVSTQAVSRWENGGAPDVARWLASLPQKDRFDQLCRLNWTALKNMTAGLGKFPEIGYLESCEQNMRESGIRHLSTSQAWLEGGERKEEKENRHEKK